MADTTDTSVELIRALVQNVSGPDVDYENWQSMSIVIDSFDGKFNGASGSLYSPNGTISIVTASPSSVLPAVEAYINDIYTPGQPRPIKFLVQFDRVSGKYSITFEDSDELRWKVTPKNYKEIRETLRPNFDEPSSNEPTASL